MSEELELLRSELLDFAERHSACRREYDRLIVGHGDVVLVILRDNFLWCAAKDDFAAICLRRRDLLSRHGMFIDEDVHAHCGIVCLLVTHGVRHAVFTGGAVGRVSCRASDETPLLEVETRDRSQVYAESFGRGVVHVNCRDRSQADCCAYDSSHQCVSLQGGAGAVCCLCDDSLLQIQSDVASSAHVYLRDRSRIEGADSSPTVFIRGDTRMLW